MKTIVRLLALGALMFGSNASAAPVYSDLYVFGDSLVDSGNAYLGTGGAEASPADGFAAGRFSNGYNFADYIALALTKSAATPVLAGGHNLAVGGATAEGPTGLTGQTFKSQTDLYNVYVGAPIPASALVLVTFGGNDVRDTILQPGTPSFAKASIDFAAGLNALYDRGARNFVIVGAPDIGDLPISRQVAAALMNPGLLGVLTDRSQTISDLFEGDAATLDEKAGTEVKFVDLLALENRLKANPGHFGLPDDLNTTTPCQVLGGGTPQLNNCASSLYFDKIHPTTRVHLAIARAILSDIGVTSGVPEPATWMMMVLGFGAVGASMRRMNRNPALLAA